MVDITEKLYFKGRVIFFFSIMQAVGEARAGIHDSPAGTVVITSIAVGFSTPEFYEHL